MQRGVAKTSRTSQRRHANPGALVSASPQSMASASGCDCTQWLKVAGAVLLPAATWLALWSRLSKPFQFRLAANTGKEAEAVTYPEYEVRAHTR